MKKWKLIVAAALLAIISGAAVSIPVESANQAIFGQWNFELVVSIGVLDPDTKGDDDDECVFAGDLDLKNQPLAPIKEISVIGDPVSGGAQMALVSGDCGDFNGVISGGAAGPSIFFNMEVFPTGLVKEEDKGALVILFLEGQLYDDDLMSGGVTGASAPFKGEFGSWRATRTASVPTLTPVGILALLAGLGLVGGIALRRRK